MHIKATMRINCYGTCCDPEVLILLFFQYQSKYVQYVTKHLIQKNQTNKQTKKPIK